MWILIENGTPATGLNFRKEKSNWKRLKIYWRGRGKDEDGKG